MNLNDPGAYCEQTESMNLSTGGMQIFHVPQHHVTLSPNELVMVNSAEPDYTNENNMLMAQQYEQSLMMPIDGHNYSHLSDYQSYPDLQQRYVYVDPNYVQQYQELQQCKESESNIPLYMVSQSSEAMGIPVQYEQGIYEPEAINFTSPPASPYVEQINETYPNVDREVEVQEVVVEEAEEVHEQEEIRQEELRREELRQEELRREELQHEVLRHQEIRHEEVHEEEEKDSVTSDEWESEHNHYKKVVATFLQYKDHLKNETQKTLMYVRSLPSKQRELLKDYYTHLEEVLQCMDVNQDVFNLICSQDKNIFENQNDKFSMANKINNLPQPTRFDFDKLQAVLKQIVRDWTLEGEHERSLCYAPIIEEVERRYSIEKHRRDIRVLVPGAGLGRLAHELVARSYVVEGNEFSLFMLFASNFILNKCSGNTKYRIHPWVHQNCNVFHHLDQIRPVTFPDIDPADIIPNARFSMIAGDFYDIYKHPNQQEAWDCVVTCFFIDCANNIVSFIERIYGILKPGGVWISLGPLLYHYADMTGENSIEPPLDFLVEIIERLGFSIDRNVRLPTKYTENRMSMLNYTYTSAFLCCTKIPLSPSSEDEAMERIVEITEEYDEVREISDSD